MAMKRTLKVKWDAFKKGIPRNVSCCNPTYSTYLKKKSLEMQVSTSKKPTKTYKSYKCKQKLGKKSMLDKKIIVLLLVHLSQMTLPTIVFFAHCNSMKTAAKTSMRRPSFLSRQFHSKPAILTSILFSFYVAFQIPTPNFKRSQR